MNLAWLVRRWLSQQAQAHVRETVAQAARQQAGSTQAENSGDATPERCDVGIVFALGAEAGGTEDLLADTLTTKGKGFLAHQGTLSGRRVVVVESGAGRLAAARATQALIGAHKPEWVISAGFAGGLNSAVERGGIVIGSEIVDVSGRALSIDLRGEYAPAARVHVGRLLTVDKIVRAPAEKKALGEQHQALAVDMESWAVGEVCRQDKVRFLAIRVISDAVDDELPKELDRLVMQTSTAGRLGAAAGTLIRRPSSIKDMWRLKEEALVASDALAKFLAQLVRQIVPRDKSAET
ncbi:MAG: 5'-methylthioadenosine nucleosidase [Planctomycetia bacterium]|nr:5'-methylthioadenosine nucleosidase [Planctomycetia bacterium]